MASIALHGVSKVYPDGTRAVNDLSLTVADGEFMVLVGPSGCGKSTILRIIAGLEDVSDGDVSIGERSVVGVSPAKRDVAMVFQSYALYPHMTVRRNMEIGLKLHGVEKAERRARVHEVATMLGIGELLDRRPARLSGGERQRVAMGRAIVRNPAVFLLDEPLSNLDAQLRAEVRAEIRALQIELGVTTVLVTHDQVEAMTMADRIAILRGGTLQQLGAPADLYARPSNLFVGEFIGSPVMNILRGQLVIDGRGSVLLRYAPDSGVLDLGRADALGLSSSDNGREVVAGVRPEHLVVGSAAGGGLEATVRAVESLGNENIVHVSLGIGSPSVRPGGAEQRAREARLSSEGSTVRRVGRGGAESEFRLRTPASDPPLHVGSAVQVTVAPGTCHVFDGDNGNRLGRSSA